MTRQRINRTDPTKPKRPMPKKVQVNVTPEMIKEIELLSGRGLTQGQLQDYYGLKSETWYALKNNIPEMEAAIQAGKSKTISFVGGKLIELIKKGNVAATIFYLKTQAGFRDREVIHVEATVAATTTQTSVVTTAMLDPIEASKIYQKIMMEN